MIGHGTEIKAQNHNSEFQASQELKFNNPNITAPQFEIEQTGI